MVDVSLLDAEDGAHLTALLQSMNDDAGAPDAAAYDHHSSTSIVDQLEDLLDKARAQVSESRKKELSAEHNFEMQKRAIEEEMAYANQDLKSTKKDISIKTENKATAGSDYAETKKQLGEDEKMLALLQHDCAEKAEVQRAEQVSRAEELEALAAATKVLAETTQAAQAHTYSLEQAPSFMQVSVAANAGLSHFEVVRIVSELAKTQHSEELAQLSRRISTTFRRAAATGTDPFSKVKGLIKSLITRLEKEAQTDASHKAYCDKEKADTQSKHDDTKAIIDRLTTEIDARTARTAKHKSQLAEFHASLATTAQSRKNMQEVRNEEHTLFEHNKPEMEAGIEGVNTALKVLRDYYNRDDKSHNAATGGASSMIGMLEVVVSDFSKVYGEMTVTEEASQEDFEREMHEMDIEVATKEQGIKYTERELIDLAKDLAQRKADRVSESSELEAINEYKAKIVEMCMPKVETYAELTARRDAEIVGLKEALTVLQDQATLLQRRAHRN
eukprot:NODE_5808_length_1733_cov_5.932752.p1 GENE.NODE_5808_length_1733_cov_5.932752~~NODE_5808_length_1733_cov_5.932752.p1  ORF type:complete len:529 (+),score=218.91 NODE_5808_length_1733_cov_5.932752:84-1589(+)